MKIEQAKIRDVKNLSESQSIHKKNITISNQGNKGEYYFIKTKDLIPFKNQARVHFDPDKIRDLAESIKRYGLRQPLTIMPDSKKNGLYQIVSGERRYKAAQLLGLEKIPCLILDHIKNADEIAIIENIKREDLHPIELGMAYKTLSSKPQFSTHDKIAMHLGVPRSKVTECLALSKFSKKIQHEIIKNNIKERKYLRKILKEKDEVEQLGIIDKIKSPKRNSVPRLEILKINLINKEVIITESFSKIPSACRDSICEAIKKLHNDLTNIQKN